MRKQLLYLTDHDLTAYTWRNGRIQAEARFSADPVGWRDFDDYLQRHGRRPADLIADLVEENFQSHKLPHLNGRLKRAMLRLRLKQAYPDTSYVQASIQGRESSGRRDDHILFSALTHPDVIQPWIDRLLQRQVPLRGIYSPALLSMALVKKLGLGNGHVVLVTHQANSLRQTYFRHGQLQFSRLTPLAAQAIPTVASVLAAETRKTQQFLLSMRQQELVDHMHFVIVASEAPLAELQAACHDHSSLTHSFLKLEALLALCKVEPHAIPGSAEWLFLGIVARQARNGNYAIAAQTIFFRWWQTRLALYGLSALLLAAGTGWTGFNSVQANQLRGDLNAMASETTATLEQYEGIMRQLRPTEVRPQTMKLAVNLTQLLSRNAATPHAALDLLSRALETQPQIRLEQLQWQAAPESGSALPSPNAPLANDGTLSGLLVGIPQPSTQVLLIDGVVPSEDGDVRTALDGVRQLVAVLQRQAWQSVEILRQPLDVRSDAVLEGSSNGGVDPKATFQLKLTLQPKG